MPAAPPPGAPTPPGGEPAPDQQLLAIFQQYGQLVLNALNNSTPGYEFADYVVGLLGAGTHAAIANYGEDALVSTMMQIAEFQIFGQPHLKQFAHEFVNFEEFGDDDDAGETKPTAGGR